MMKYEATHGFFDESHLLEMEDESVLADGMIPDSRVINLIDELDQIDDYMNDDSEMTWNALKLHMDEEE